MKTVSVFLWEDKIWIKTCCVCGSELGCGVCERLHARMLRYLAGTPPSKLDVKLITLIKSHQPLLCFVSKHVYDRETLCCITYLGKGESNHAIKWTFFVDYHIGTGHCDFY